MKKDAVLSGDRKYRYLLSPTWDDTKPTILFLWLNLSTADEKEDDLTMNKCVNYAKSWGYGKNLMANLFAFRSTDPSTLNHVPKIRNVYPKLIWKLSKALSLLSQFIYLNFIFIS